MAKKPYDRYDTRTPFDRLRTRLRYLRTQDAGVITGVWLLSHHRLLLFLVTDARVEQGIDHIHDKHGHRNRDHDDQNDPVDHKIIELSN